MINAQSLFRAIRHHMARPIAEPTEDRIPRAVVNFPAGEVVKVGQAVIALLPPRNLKVRFFVDEPDRARLRVDQRVALSCDGCPPDLHAKINFIAREAEFTPPVIFSREQRQKLVYLIEARPEGEAEALTAGQPVTVTLAPGEQMVRR
ncbi:MAG: HlyD family efflux transporter periplasmic adaptor subunit [Sphingomonadales bacterium]|nr:HlyD family efflux transporter periplasmic adaptor subunit [Sphingomonadales bacterium]